jgi:hypothetical protein
LHQASRCVEAASHGAPQNVSYLPSFILPDLRVPRHPLILCFPFNSRLLRRLARAIPLREFGTYWSAANCSDAVCTINLFPAIQTRTAQCRRILHHLTVVPNFAAARGLGASVCEIHLAALIGQSLLNVQYDGIEGFCGTSFSHVA